MNKEKELTPKPIVIAYKLDAGSLLESLLDSSPFRFKIHFGKLGQDGKTVTTLRGFSFVADNVQAEPGDIVVTHEI